MPSAPGARNLITDVAGISVGSAHDERVRTGTTVILAEEPAVAALAVAGGGPGTRESDALAPDTLVEAVDAIVLSGGSAYGLAAAEGVVARLGARGRGFALRKAEGVPVTPIVPAAILYDLANGGDKSWGEAPPYRELGAAALDACDASFDLGAAGAGFGAMAGQEAGGLGSASVRTADGMTIGALVAVNCFGSVRMPGEKAFWAWPFEHETEFGGQRPPADFSLDADNWGEAKLNPAMMEGRANTTIACVATDVALSVAEAQRVAKMALAGMARAIRPVFAPFDGDAVFALSTGKLVAEGPRPLLIARLGELAANCLARAIARGVHEAAH